MVRIAIFLIFLCVHLLVADAVWAQRGGRGGGRGRGGGGDGNGGGDFRERMLQRMDANGNGIVEPNEVPEQARGFLDRIAQGAGVEPGQPIPISRVTGQPESNPNGNGSNRSPNQQAGELYPRVPVFGDESVRGFGVSPESLNGRLVNLEKKYDRRVLDSVDRTLERYDKNKNGLLEHDEWLSVTWRSDPRDSDLDKDGLLTKAELAERYRDRQEEEAESNGRDSGASRGGASRRGGGERGSGGPGGGGPAFFGGFGGFGGRGGGGGEGDGESGGRGRGGRGGRGGFDPASMIGRFDRDGNGVIEPGEVDDRVKGFVESRFGVSFDQPVKVDDLVKQITGGQNGSPAKPKSKAAVETPVENGYRVSGQDKLQGRKSYRLREPALPKLIPDWWNDRDTNRDGQVRLDEFAQRPSDDSVREFQQYDQNRDGVITAQEASSKAGPSAP